jgi:hypothetical protein
MDPSQPWPKSAKVIVAILVVTIIIMIIIQSVAYYNKPCPEYYEGQGPSCKRFEMTVALLKLRSKLIDEKVSINDKVVSAGQLLVTYPDLISMMISTQMKENPAQFDDIQKKLLSSN